VSRTTLVSVIIPVHNGEPFIAEAIASVLAQRHRPIEIVVVDDGSTDASAAIVRAQGKAVRYRYQPRAGVAAARNAGLALAAGDLIGFLDQDDLWAKDKLAVLLPRLAADPRLEAIYGLTSRIVMGQREAPAPVFDWHLGSALFRRSLFSLIGRFDETVRYHADDTDFFLRLRESGARIDYVDRVTLTYRTHGGNTSLAMGGPARVFFVEVLKRSLDRRRKAADMSVSPLPEFVHRLAAGAQPEENHE
jgi:glycosyltransferase involved in cell wall biosynthesis